MSADRFGFGWRPELAAATMAHIDQIDVLEVIADDYFRASSKEVRALRTLGSQAAVMLHGVGLGMGSVSPVDDRRLDAFARLVDAVQPEAWSEHLAFVRAGGIEIGHLAAPPRNPAGIDGILGNIHRASNRIGSRPWMENVSTLIDPPGSTMSEPEWLRAITRETSLLLDLHNVYTNAFNFGFDPCALLDSLDLKGPLVIHIAGGRILGERMLDDHLHSVPARVYDLLSYVAARNMGGLTVLLERDGEYPPFPKLMEELAKARAAVAAGRKA